METCSVGHHINSSGKCRCDDFAAANEIQTPAQKAREWLTENVATEENFVAGGIDLDKTSIYLYHLFQFYQTQTPNYYLCFRCGEPLQDSWIVDGNTTRHKDGECPPKVMIPQPMKIPEITLPILGTLVSDGPPGSGIFGKKSTFMNPEVSGQACLCNESPGDNVFCPHHGNPDRWLRKGD